MMTTVYSDYHEMRQELSASLRVATMRIAVAAAIAMLLFVAIAYGQPGGRESRVPAFEQQQMIYRASVPFRAVP